MRLPGGPTDEDCSAPNRNSAAHRLSACADKVAGISSINRAADRRPDKERSLPVIIFSFQDISRESEASRSPQKGSTAEEGSDFVPCPLKNRVHAVAQT